MPARRSSNVSRYNRVVMSRTIQEIESRGTTVVLQLNPHDRTTLANGSSTAWRRLRKREYEELWIEDGEARYAAFRAGKTSAVDGDEVFAKARARNR